MAELADQDGWHVEGYAARVHYQGDGDRYSVEYYEPSECVLYWRIKGDARTAVPVDRGSVPAPLRERIRQDLVDAAVDPEIERRTV